MPGVITYQAPNGQQINVTPAQEKTLRAAGVWPRNDVGEEYCQVAHGLHAGEPTFSDATIAAIAATSEAKHTPRPVDEYPHEAAGLPALERLIRIAKGDSGQCRRVRRLLLSLYNSEAFPADLTDLRALDDAIVRDVLLVFAMDARPRVEIHMREGAEIIATWAGDVWPERCPQCEQPIRVG